MIATNKPSAGEPVVELVKDPVLGDKYICTRVFWNFLDELTVANNENSESVSGGDGIAAINARIAQIEYDIFDNPFTIDSTGWTIDTTRLTIDMAKA